MKEYPNGNDVKEEREFVEKIFNTQTGPVHTYIRSPWSNNVSRVVSRWVVVVPLINSKKYY